MNGSPAAFPSHSITQTTTIALSHSHHTHSPCCSREILGLCTLSRAHLVACLPPPLALPGSILCPVVTARMVCGAAQPYHCKSLCLHLTRIYILNCVTLSSTARCYAMRFLYYSSSSKFWIMITTTLFES